ncbi:hypothetical protein ATN84_24730 [Paramesorhizobium deserti]|uniref:Uncharacterized protein n=1 Tax=Paramesorhizobium deserti TaxID=1494590 RepID=A0A135HXL0_9HYPH|nr:hypothetical protein [Paramesorhizobium deserti]KXF77925.1 hypothetical protein ATN84_24730 [Paramesorhizobium deserti]
MTTSEFSGQYIDAGTGRQLGGNLPVAPFKNIPHQRSYLSLIAAILRRTPVHFGAIVLVVFVSQTAMFATFWLPWKVLVVLSGGEPWLLPASVATLPQESQVLILSLAAVLAYLLHLSGEKITGWLCVRGARRQRLAGGKTGLFNNQREIAEQIYRRITRCLADACFVAVSLWLLFLLYPAILVVFVSWSLLFGAVIWCAAICWRPVRHWLASSLGWVLGLYANTGFFCALGWLIWAHWHGAMPPFYVSFILLFVLRQALQQSTSVVLNLRNLMRQKSQAMALFLPDVPWPSPPSRNSPFDDLLRAEHRIGWIRKLVQSYEGVIEGDWTVRMSMMEAGNIALFFVTIAESSKEKPVSKGYLVKLYNHTRDALAQQEADLLNVEGAFLPTFEWLGEDKVKGYLCHLMRWQPHAERLEGAAYTAAANAIRTQLLSHDPSPSLIDKYRRSRPNLRARLKPDMCEVILQSVADEKQIQNMEDLRDIWSDLVSVLDDLPEQLVLPWLGGQPAYKEEGGRPCLYHWSGWCLEPVGAGWPLSSRTNRELRDAIGHAAKVRPVLLTVPLRAAELTAHLFEFERRFAGKNYSGAANMVPNLLRVYLPEELDPTLQKPEPAKSDSLSVK